MTNTTIQALRRELKRQRAIGLKWREIGIAYPNVKHGTLSRIVHDATYEPKDAKIRASLYLSPNTVAVSPLPCGCPPQGTRCKVHGKPSSTTPNATRKRDKRIEAMRAGLQLARTLDSMTG